jgi:hypothetical protein
MKPFTFGNWLKRDGPNPLEYPSMEVFTDWLRDSLMKREANDDGNSGAKSEDDDMVSD